MRLAVVVLALALASQSAHADTVEEPAVESYRGTTLAMDGVAVGLTAVGLGGDVAVLALIGVPLYLVGPPLMHLSNNRPRSALASVGMRVGLPLIGVAIGDSISRDCKSGDCNEAPSTGILLGLSTGLVAASVLDAVFLADGDAPRTPKTSWRPVAHSTRGGFALGIAGQF